MTAVSKMLKKHWCWCNWY